MNTAIAPSHSNSSPLRARPADFFRMEVAQKVAHSPVRDTHPLRRSLNTLQDSDLYVSNEYMCTAMWQLMQRC